eukprot:7378014-Prymnesium_polylepis.3
MPPDPAPIAIRVTCHIKVSTLTGLSRMSVTAHSQLDGHRRAALKWCLVRSCGRGCHRNRWCAPLGDARATGVPTWLARSLTEFDFVE